MSKKREEVKHFSLEAHMSHVKVKLLSRENYSPYIDTFALAIVPKNLPTTVGARNEQPNIVVICIEESSAHHLERHMRRTVRTMEEMKFMKFEKHADQSGNIDKNLLVLINGEKSRQPGAQKNSPVSGAGGSIFKLAKEFNYVSMLASLDPKRTSKLAKESKVCITGKFRYPAYAKLSFDLELHIFI